ncbi:MAG TPA: hypothetical protein VFT06_13300 [Flavisolibacter sp.]|nr:hypothetical protein [Flavisolibacter sp.]
MSRKLLLLILVPAILLIAGYFALQVYLRAGNRKEEKELEQTFGAAAAAEAKVDSLGGKKVSPADLRPLFVERMKQLLMKSSNGLYDLSVGDLKVDVPASTISLQNVTVGPDAKALENLKASGLLPNDVFSIAFKNLVLEGVNLDDVLTSKTMDYKLIRLVNPVIEIDHRKAKESKTEGDFAQRFLKQMEKLSVNKLVVEGGSIIVHDRQKGTRKKLANVQVLMNDILLNEETRKDKNRFLYAKEARLDFHQYTSTTKDGLYRFKIGDVSVNASQKQITLKNLSFGSPLSKEAFVAKQKKAKEMYSLSLPSMTINGVDWWSLLNEEEVIAREAETKGGKFTVYFDRALPPKNKMGNFPNQLLLKLPLQLNIARLKIRDLAVSYEERNPLSQQSGTVYLDNASMDFTNVNNNSKTPVVVNGTALLMHKIPVRAMFRFDMSGAKSGRFSASIQSTTPYDGRLLNTVAVPLGMMKVEKADLKKLTATIKGDENGAGGDVEVLYKDLKLTLLEKDKGKVALDKKDVTSFLANLVLKKDNPKDGKAPRQEQAQFRRDPNGGFMMLVWKTVLVGILKTIGAPEKLAYKKSK